MPTASLPLIDHVYRNGVEDLLVIQVNRAVVVCIPQNDERKFALGGATWTLPTVTWNKQNPTKLRRVASEEIV